MPWPPKRIAILVSMSIVLVCVLYVTLRMIASWQRHYSWKDMDWNGDGSTTIAEVLEASDIGHRLATHQGRTGIEYYSL